MMKDTKVTEPDNRIWLIIDETNVHESPYQLHNFSAEASSLGLRPGQWPNLIRTTLGNRQQFIFERWQQSDEGELQAAIFRQIGGCLKLTIFND